MFSWDVNIRSRRYEYVRTYYVQVVWWSRNNHLRKRLNVREREIVFVRRIGTYESNHWMPYHRPPVSFWIQWNVIIKTATPPTAVTRIRSREDINKPLTSKGLFDWQMGICELYDFSFAVNIHLVPNMWTKYYAGTLIKDPPCRRRRGQGFLKY